MNAICEEQWKVPSLSGEVKSTPGPGSKQHPRPQPGLSHVND